MRLPTPVQSREGTASTSHHRDNRRWRDHEKHKLEKTPISFVLLSIRSIIWSRWTRPSEDGSFELPLTSEERPQSEGARTVVCRIHRQPKKRLRVVPLCTKNERCKPAEQGLTISVAEGYSQNSSLPTSISMER